MARHVEQGPYLVHDLIAAACARTMLNQALELVQLPDAPNLYWALASLPHPFVDVRPSIELELALLEIGLPATQHLDQIQTPNEWKRLLYDLLDEQYSSASDSPLGNPRALVTYLVECQAKAQRYFWAHKTFSAEELNSMSLEELLVRWMLHPYERVRDDQLKWTFVPPFAVAGPFPPNAANHDIDADRSDFVDQFYRLSAVGTRSIALMDQRFAALQVIEALRMHAAQHGGQLPSDLDEVNIVPVPLDPMTGKPFHYELMDGTAELRSTHQTDGVVHYRLRMRSATTRHP